MKNVNFFLHWFLKNQKRENTEKLKGFIQFHKLQTHSSFQLFLTKRSRKWKTFNKDDLHIWVNQSFQSFQSFH